MSTVSIAINGVTATNVTGWEIKAAGGYCWECRIQFSGTTFWADLDPLTNPYDLKIVITVDGTDYSFLAEERSETISVPGVDWEVWGRSAQAVLGEKFAVTITDTLDTEYDPDTGLGHVWQNNQTSASAIITYVINNYCGDNSVGITWTAIDYAVHVGTFSCENMYPIDIITRLAEAVGAEIMANPDGSLTIQPYIVSGGTSVAAYTDTDHIVSLSTRLESTAGYNAVLILGRNDVIEDPGNPGVTSDEQSGGVMSAVIDPTQAGVETGVGEWHVFRVYFYHPTIASPTISAHSTATGFDYESGLPVSESVTETVELKWGQGRTSQTPTDGNTLVDEPSDYNEAYSFKSVTYTVKYAPAQVKSTVAGIHKVALYFSDKSAETEYTFTVVDCDAQHPELCGEAGCLSVGGRWIGGACVIPGPIQLNAASVISGPVTPGTTFWVRTYYFHPDNTPPSTDVATGDDVVVTNILTSTLSITETIDLAYGAGTYSRWDENGNNAYYDPAYVNNPFEQVEVTYSCPYIDWSLVSSTEGDHSVLFYYPSVSSKITYEVSTGGVGEVYRAQTLQFLNVFSEVPITGAQVFLDGTPIGSTDGNGYIVTDPLLVGSSHTIKAVHGSYQDTDLDILENDGFVAQ